MDIVRPFLIGLAAEKTTGPVGNLPNPSGGEPLLPVFPPQRDEDEDTGSPAWGDLEPIQELPTLEGEHGREGLDLEAGPSNSPQEAAECSTSNSGVQDPLYQKIKAKKAELCHIVESLYKEAMVGIGLIEVRECKIENLPEVVKSVVDEYAPGTDNKNFKEMHRSYASLLTRLKKKDKGLGCEVRSDIRKSIREDLITGKVRVRICTPEDPVD